jgi:hypothetical protein
MSLPVADLDNITCWENIQFALLSMNDEAFDVFLMTSVEFKEYQKNKNVDNQTLVDIPRDKHNNIITGDKFIDEIEKAFNSDNMDDVESLLDVFDKL